MIFSASLKRTCMMTENNTTNNPTEADPTQTDHQTEQRVPQPQKKRANGDLH